MKKGKKTKIIWQIYNEKNGVVIAETSDLNKAWELVEVASKCGHCLNVRKKLKRR